MLSAVKKRLSFVVPRWVAVPVGRLDGQVATSGDDLVERAMLWWKDDAYTQLPRRQHLRWMGINWSSRTVHRTIKGDYGGPADDMVALIEEMQGAGLVPRLTASSTIFEGGCNIGRNLQFLQDRFHCAVVGLDISEGALRERESIWHTRSRHQFILDNALTTEFFDSCADQQFDLVFTRWHLIHIPRSDAKRRYVASLKRIAKTLVLVEPAREGSSEVTLFQGGTYTLSWDDWAREYGLTEYRSPSGLSLGPDTRVFFHANANAETPDEAR